MKGAASLRQVARDKAAPHHNDWGTNSADEDYNGRFCFSSNWLAYVAGSFHSNRVDHAWKMRSRAMIGIPLKGSHHWRRATCREALALALCVREG